MVVQNDNESPWYPKSLKKKNTQIQDIHCCLIGIPISWFIKKITTKWQAENISCLETCQPLTDFVKTAGRWVLVQRLRLCPLRPLDAPHTWWDTGVPGAQNPEDKLLYYEVSHEKKAPILSIESWLVNRDPDFMVYYNPYITG